jgi:transposase
VESASPAEVRLVEPTLEARFLADFPSRLIGDRAYDSDPLDAQLMQRWGIELIARHRSTRKIPTQDGRAARRTKRRWKIERLFAWFHNSRRLVVRWERKAENYTAFLHLACILILLKHL